MPSKFCTGCWRLFPKGQLDGGRCRTCRGTRQQRGVGGPEYDAFARLIREHQLCCECGGECGVSHAKPGLQVGLPMCAHPFGDPDNPITVGHKVPRVAGGDNRWSNLRPECRACNLRKGGR